MGLPSVPDSLTIYTCRKGYRLQVSGNRILEGSLGRGMGAEAPNEGASLGERLSLRRELLRLFLDSAGWRRAKVRLRPAALQRQLARLSASVHAVQPLPHLCT